MPSINRQKKGTASTSSGARGKAAQKKSNDAPKRRKSCNQKKKPSTAPTAENQKAGRKRSSDFIDNEASEERQDEGSARDAKEKTPRKRKDQTSVREPGSGESDSGEEAETDDTFVTDNSSIEGNSQNTHRALDKKLEDKQALTYRGVIQNLGSLSKVADETPSTSNQEPSETPSTSNQVPSETPSTSSQVPSETPGTSREPREEVGNAGSDPAQVQPYFPVALARSQEQPTQFNFELFMFDTLTLPRGLFSEEEREEVTFQDTKECVEYCERYVSDCEKELGRLQEEDQRANLSKEEMFRASGQSIANLRTGNDTFDANLDKLRVDIYGNVMVLNAPQWSDISPQFTHGFPRRLISEGHRGILPGNLTVAARISNQAIRSLSIGDVASFISRKMVKGLGLTLSELVLARTMTHAHTHSESDSESSDTSSDVEVPSSWDIAHECGDSMPGPHTRGHSNSVRIHVHNLMSSYLSTSAQKDAPQPPSGAQVTTRARTHASGQRRRRPAGRTTGPIMPVIPSVETGDSQEQVASSRLDARAALMAQAGIDIARIPKDDSLARLAEYLRTHQPLPSEQVEMTRNPEDPRVRRFQQRFHTVHTAAVEKARQELWDASKSDCLCLSEPHGGNSSQGTDPGDDCPYVRMSDEGGEIRNVNRLCRNTECRICGLMDYCELTSHVELGVSKNASLTAKLQVSKHIAHLLNSGDIDDDRVAAITEALCTLLSCKRTKLRNVANTGFLTMLCPFLECVQLQSGWGTLWSSLSKIGSSVGHHKGRRNQVAALLFVRKKCILAPESNWHFYLQTDEEEEREIMDTVFAGCF
ncbi:hypothetical protein ACROYT_G004247 [Oculina patagonica]